MKKHSMATALVAFLFSILFGATAFAQQQITLEPWASTQLGGVTLAIGKAVKAAEARVEFYRIEFNSCGACSQAETNRRWQQLDQAIKDLSDIQRDTRRINGRIELLKKAGVAQRKDLDQLRIDVAGLKGLEAADREQIKGILGKLSEMKIEQGKQAARQDGFEQRLDRTDHNLDVVHTDVVDLKANAWRNQLRFGLFTGRGLATSETGVLFGYGALNPAGIGWYSNLALGAGDMFSNPHPTSFVVRAGGQTTVGGPNSPLSFNLGLTGGAAAKTSLSADIGASFGFHAGLNWTPDFAQGAGLTVLADQVFGRYEGWTVFAGVFFDPLKLADLGK